MGSQSTAEFRNKTVCVTGATGGIGARAVEKLVLEHGARVRVLVRNMTRAPRIARLPVEFVCGDVTSPEQIGQAVKGSDLVLHCAHGGNTSDPEAHRRTNLSGTENVLRACRTHGARLVHVSTCRVFGMKTPDGDVDESFPYRPSGQAYADSKLEAEKLVFDWHARYGVPVSVIQPTTVYGPFVQVWTLAYMKMLSRFRPILVDGGAGLCNAVYVDDVVDAMLLAGVRGQALGQNFLISAREPITWREFHAGFAALLGAPPAVSMSRAEALAHAKQAGAAGPPRPRGAALPPHWREESAVRKRIANTVEYAALRRLKRRLLPKRGGPAAVRAGTVRPRPTAPAEPLPVRPLTPAEVDFFAARTRFRIDKAQRLLGYVPQFDFAAGMAMVDRWARWANLVPGPDPFFEAAGAIPDASARLKRVPA